ncbi:MAG: FG-GAP repeat domain-containing protein, partial [Thermoanaerobaculia bacterium]
GDGTFDAPSRVVIPNPLGAAAGRFNADARLDLAVVDGVGKVTVLLQGERGRRDWTAGTLDAAGFFVHAADFDADGFDDLVLAHPGGSASFLRCKGDGTFEARVTLPETRGARWAASGDLDADGRLDLATANHSATSVSVFLGSGGGALAHLANHHFPGWPHSIAAADVDGDSTLDLVVGLPSGFELLRGTGGGRFAGQAALPETQGCHQILFTGDFNQDGLPDLVDTCGVELNQGGWSFRRSLDAPSWAAAVVDVDGDGPLDVVLAANGPAGPADPPALFVHRGESDGSFQPASVSHAFGLWPNFLLGRDLDGDGRGDLVATDPQAQAVAVFWGKPEERFLGVGYAVRGFAALRTAAVGDLDADGRPDLFLQDFLEPRVQVYLHPGLSEPDAPTLAIEPGALYT